MPTRNRSLQIQIFGLDPVDEKTKTIALIEDKMNALLTLIENRYKLSENILIIVAEEAKNYSDNPLAKIIYAQCMVVYAHLYYDPNSSYRVDMKTQADIALFSLDGIEEKISSLPYLENKMQLF